MEIDGLVIIVTRRRNAKRLSLRIDSRTGQLNLSAPVYVTKAQIIEFISKNRHEIDRAILKSSINQSSHIDDPIEKQRKKKILHEKISSRLPVIESYSGFKASGWSIRDMHSRWGSCNTRTHHINFSLMLADRSDIEIDYVILHELVHTKVPNHGKDFYSEMDALMPGWKKIRRGMR